MGQESDHERVRRLIEERLKFSRPTSVPEPSPGALRMLAAAIFHAAFLEAYREERERKAGITPGDPNTPTSWAELEAILGKDTVRRMRGTVE